MLNKVVNKTGRTDDNPSILNKVVSTIDIDKDLIEANPILDKVVNTIDPLPSGGSGDAISSCVIACIDKNIKDVQCVTCINTCDIESIKNTTCVSLEKVTADCINANNLSAVCIEADNISTSKFTTECIDVDNAYIQKLDYGYISVTKCTSSPKAVVAVKDGVLCSSLSVCVDDDTVYSEKVCSDNFYGSLKGKADNATCFDGRTFEEAKTEILSGKAKCSEVADYAKNVCIESCISGEGFIPFVDNKCVMFLAEKYNPKVMFNKDGICVSLDGCLVTKDINTVCSCTREAVTDTLEVGTCASFKGPVYIYDNIYQCGESWCTHAQNIYTCSDTITLREGATFAGNAQIVALKYDGTNNGVIFLGTDGTLRVGDENNCQPVLTRSEEKDLTDGHVLVWDATNRCARDSGEALVTCAYVNCIGSVCKEEAKTYTDICDCCTRDYVDLCFTCIDEYTKGACNYTNFCTTCVCTYAKNYTDTKALCSCVYASTCGHSIGSSCKTAACLYTSCTDSCNKTWTTACICTACIDSYNHADCVGTECYKKACSCAINVDKLCYACSKSYADTVGTDCYKKACLCALNTDKICYACSKAYSDTNSLCACVYGVTCATSYADCVGSACYKGACTCAISMDALCLACSYDCGKSVCTSAISRENTCKSCAYACANSVCCNTITRDTLCLACSCAYTDTKALCSCAYAVTCGHAIGSACKNDAMATKANCYGNSYNCVQCSYIAKRVDLECLISAEKRYVYIGRPTGFSTGTNVGCNPNLWFCPTCNVFVIDGSTGSCGSAICLTGVGSCLMNGVCSRLNPSIVFATTDKQCGCLQYSQYDSVHPGAGLCWATNTPHTWFQTDCIFANKFINRNGCQIGGYCATIPSPNGATKYALLDLGNTDGVAYFSVHDNEGTIVKALSTEPHGKVYAQNSYGITGYCNIGTEKNQSACIWLRYNGWRIINLWGKYPIKVVSNTTANPGCTWQAPTIKPTCDYVSTVAGQCKSAACTYANTVAGQCKGVACTYAYCAINACNGIGVMGVARSTNGNCWTKGGYWAYMTSSDGPNCCWSHVIKMDWRGTGADLWTTGISIPSYSAPNSGIHYKNGCCGGHSGWTLVPNITCVHSIGTSCKNSACTSAINMDKVCLACSYACTDTKALCACVFAASCVQAVVPETSTFANCYGGSTNCVECADKIRLYSTYTNGDYDIPFAKFSGNTPNVNFSRSIYFRYKPSTDTLCTSNIATSSLSVSNKKGCFMLGNYCIYIE